MSELLQRAGIDEPPIDPFEVARHAGHETQFDASLGQRGDVRWHGDGAVLMVRPEAPTVCAASERECFACAHEVAEAGAAAEALRRAGVESVSSELREWTCNLFAGALLAPAEWFRSEYHACDGDLRWLKSVFATASHEVLARRFLTWETPTVITVLDNGRVTSRAGNCEYSPLTPAELAAIEQSAVDGRHDVDTVSGGFRIQVWPVDTDGWRREIVRLTVDS